MADQVQNDNVQLLRLLDVFVFGPLMIASARSQTDRYFRTALTVVGIGTIVYNGARFIEQRKLQSAGAVAGSHAAPLGRVASRI